MSRQNRQELANYVDEFWEFWEARINRIAGMIASIALIAIGVYALLHSLDAPVSERRTLIGGADDGKAWIDIDRWADDYDRIEPEWNS